MCGEQIPLPDLRMLDPPLRHPSAPAEFWPALAKNPALTSALAGAEKAIYFIETFALF
jgi:hypothetical protein